VTSSQPDASVVIPTRNRRDDLVRCLSALDAQRTRYRFEVVVVDDGSEPPIAAGELPFRGELRILRTDGVGPGGARNAAVAASEARFVLFTDDDTIPDPAWVETACSFLDRNEGHVGVEGPVSTSDFDPLYGYSIANDRPGAYWTCNIAYRRETLLRLGGFDCAYPYAHCEDRDLAFRALAEGPIGFQSAMNVEHTARRLSIWQLIRRGRFASSELLFLRRYPDQRRGPAWIPLRLLPPLFVAEHWLREARRELRRWPRRPTRPLRWAVIALGDVLVALGNVLARPR
jgi:GT2 family glycosyltransferase